MTGSFQITMSKARTMLSFLFHISLAVGALCSRLFKNADSSSIKKTSGMQWHESQTRPSYKRSINQKYKTCIEIFFFYFFPIFARARIKLSSLRAIAARALFNSLHNVPHFYPHIPISFSSTFITWFNFRNYLLNEWRFIWGLAPTNIRTGTLS